VDHDRPNVDNDKQAEIKVLVEREEENEEVIGQRLHVAVKGMKGVRCVRSRNDPLVMGLVESLINPRNVQPAMDPVDAHIGEEEEEENREGPVRDAVVADVVVKPRVALDLTPKPRKGKEGETRDGREGAFELEADLVLEKTRVLHLIVIVEKEIGKARKGQVEQPASSARNDEERDGDSNVIVAREGREELCRGAGRVCREAWRQRE